MKGLWYTVYLVTLLFVCFLIPFAMFFYETDEDDGFCKRFGKSLCYTFAANIISILLLMITWNFFKYVDLPVRTLRANSVTDLNSLNLHGIAQTESDS